MDLFPHYSPPGDLSRDRERVLHLLPPLPWLGAALGDPTLLLQWEEGPSHSEDVEPLYRL